MPSVVIAHPSADLYGSDRVMLSSVEALIEAGYDVLVTLPAAGPLVGELERRGAAVELCLSPVLRKSALRPLGLLKLLVGTVRSLPSSVQVVRRARADVVYVNTLTIPLWIAVGRLTRRPVLCHVHEAEASAPLLVRRLLATPLLLCSRLVVNSEFSLDVLAGAFGRLRRQAEVIYNAVPGPPAVVPARDTLTAPIRLLYVGRFSPRKGTDVAVDVVTVLKDRGIDAELDLIGAEFPGYEWFTDGLRQRVIGHEVADRVHFHGFQDDVWPFLERTDIALVPSTIDEPFGNTAVESVLAARPLIVSATSGLVEAVQGYRSVIRVAPGDAAQIADAVESVAREWDRYRREAVDDAEQAAVRHAGEHYGRQLVGAVGALLPVSPPPVALGRAVASGIPAGEADAGAEPSVVVAMATFRRPSELRRTLQAVLLQIDEIGRPISVLVVDNDAAGTGRDGVDDVADPRVRYVIEPAPGIAAARNRALTESAEQDVLIFIDDDEQPKPGWLAGLLDTFGRYAPAAVVGPVVSEFDGPVDPWITAGGFFERRRLTTGTAIEAAATNNLLLDLRRIRALKMSFDERFGLSGGSDTLFTRRLSAAGESMIWCDEAIVIDHVPADRATRRWVIRRAMRYGNSWSRTSVAMSDGAASRAGARLRMSGLGAARLGVGAARLSVGTLIRSDRHRARGLRTWMKGVGYLRGAVGSTYVEYARPANAAPANAATPAA